MRRRFFTLDVFTARRFTGNPLAVALDSDGLDIVTMQAIAREFGHPETVFVFASDEAKHRARVRIFTPVRELAFAGHPTVGTAVLLAKLDGFQGLREIVLEEGVGPVACAVEARGDGGSATFKIPRAPERIGTIEDAAKAARALGLAPKDIGLEGFALEAWSAGNPFFFVPLRGLGAAARAQPDLGSWDSAFGADGPVGVFVFCRETVDPSHVYHARMFAPRSGVPEDPATGSAAAAFVGALAASGQFADGEHEVIVEQGFEMGRPSLIRIAFGLRQGVFQSGPIGGDAVIVTEGAIEA
jgi:trans-2,3-dihydro-3-hydroxyanthranilate isomerase